ncbi:MAG: tetratricopeptide repeat protein [Armatimonadota bacterium]|nr:tetratricopeptide repeat protein [Acidobacteriota bacterium]NLN89272.1 tetratricopeptide repeat protein [candidate division WS1 bacterium]
MRVARAAWMTLLLALVAGLPAVAETISNIRIEGLVQVNRSAVEAMMTSKVGSEFKLETVKEDFYRTVELGLFDPEKSQCDLKRTEGGIEVIFALVENPIISAVEVRGVNVPAVDAQKIQEAAKRRYRVGEVFNHLTASALYLEISRAYREAGYMANLAPVRVGDDGSVLVMITEVAVDRVELALVPTDGYVDEDALLAWLNIKSRQPYSRLKVDERAVAALRLGFLSRLNVDEIYDPDDPNVRGVMFLGLLEERPVPNAEGSAFIDPAKVMADLPVYRMGHLPASRVLGPQPTPTSLATLKAASENSPEDGDAAARYAFALARAGYTDDAAVAAQRAVALLEGLTDDPARAVLMARAALIAGDANRAFAVLSNLEQAGQLPPDGYPAMLQAAAFLLADKAVKEESAVRLPGDTLAWAVKVLMLCDSRDAVMATPEGTAYSSALRATWDRFQRLSDGDLATHHEAYERAIGMFALLRSAEHPFDPVEIVPESEELLSSPIQPVLDDPRLLKALSDRSAEDPEARYAWASCVVLRELALLLGGDPDAVDIDADTRRVELGAAQVALQELVSADPQRFQRASVMRALAYIVQGQDAQALDALAGLLAGPDGAMAAQLYLLAATLNPGITAESGEVLQQACRSAADRLSTVITGAEAHPHARYARYTLLGAAGDYEQGIQEANAVISGGVDDPRAWATVGFLEAKRGNIDTAATALSKAVELDPSDAYASYTLGLVKWIQTGDALPILPQLQRMNDYTPVDLAAAELAF